MPACKKMGQIEPPPVRNSFIRLIVGSSDLLYRQKNEISAQQLQISAKTEILTHFLSYNLFVLFQSNISIVVAQSDNEKEY